MENNIDNIKQAVPFFMVTNMETTLRFYIEGLGFSMKNSWMPHGKIEWCWVEREGAALMFQEYRPGHPDINSQKGTGISVCFQCLDSLMLYQEFILNGLSPKEPFVGNNLWDVALIDPDGYRIHFESPTDVPEGTRFSAWFQDRS